MLVAILIFAATLALVIWQPRGLGIGWSALGGAAVALLVTLLGLAAWLMMLLNLKTTDASHRVHREHRDDAGSAYFSRSPDG